MTHATSSSIVRSTLLALVLAVAPLTVAASSGVIAPELVAKLSTIFPVGSRPDQVKALCGEPELVNHFSSTIVVWRYVSGDNYVLFSFENGRLAAFKSLRRPPSGEASQETKLPPSPAAIPSATAKNLDRKTWKETYGQRGVALGAEIGSSRATALGALSSNGLKPAEMTCETDSSHVETCSVAPESVTWQQLDPSGQTSLLLLMFEDDRLRGVVHVIFYTDGSALARDQKEIRATFAAAFRKPAQKLGFWRRKISSLLLPMASVAEGVRWEHESVMALVVQGKIDGPTGQMPALLVIVAEKDAA